MIKKINKILLMPLLWLIKFYQLAISPMLGANCRFMPTCSAYFIEAVKKYQWKGVYLGIKRILRCHPWGGHGYDPVP